MFVDFWYAKLYCLKRTLSGIYKHTQNLLDYYYFRKSEEIQNNITGHGYIQRKEANAFWCSVHSLLLTYAAHYREIIVYCLLPALFILTPPLLFSDAQTLEQKAREYTSKHVSQFLQGIGLGQHAIAFSREDISGEMLLEATDEMLEELGITSTIEMLKIKVHGSA